MSGLLDLGMGASWWKSAIICPEPRRLVDDSDGTWLRSEDEMRAVAEDVGEGSTAISP